MKRRRKTFSLKKLAGESVRGCFLIAFMLVSVSSLLAQGLPVRGTVISATDNQPLIGVNIVEKGTTNGSVTDLDGNFQLSVSENAVLIVSYIGYVEQEVKVSPGKSVYNVTLKEDSRALDEVVVVG